MEYWSVGTIKYPAMEKGDYTMMENQAPRYVASCFLATLLVCFAWVAGYADDIAQIRQRGVIRHLGVPYANFVTGSGDGLDVELMQLFASYLGVEYEYVKTSWEEAIPDLTGRKSAVQGDDVQVIGESPVKGDVIANGMTVLPQREKMVAFSTPTFPTQVWLIARSDSAINPIHPTGSIEEDIKIVRGLLNGHEVMGIRNTCLDPDLHNLKATGASVMVFPGSLNELAPAVINGEAETTILDVPDALIALQKWPGKIKIIGPISREQVMGCAFDKASGELREAFNRFLEEYKKDGTYMRLINKYYPRVSLHFPEFFQGIQNR